MATLVLLNIKACMIHQEWHSYWVSSYLANPAAKFVASQTLENIPAQHWLSSNLIGHAYTFGSLHVLILATYNMYQNA